MKTIQHRFLGDVRTPQEIKDLRQSSFDFHEELGFPVVLKHRWTLKDFKDGKVERCPLHDDLYSSDGQWDSTCFGTGFVGGFADAEIVYITLSDAPTDTIKITEQGLLTLDHHPRLTAPWIPQLQDDDMLILAEFDPESWEILDLQERYVLETVNPVTVRGPNFQRVGRNGVGKPLVVHQEAEVDKLPYGHAFYEVPLYFDAESAGGDVTPPDEDPDDPGTVGTFSEYDTVVKIRGAEQFFSSSHENVFVLAVAGDPSNTDTAIRIYGEAEGVEFHW